MLGSCDGGSSCAYTNTIAWRTPTTPLPIENDPRAVFERLFGTSGSTDRAARLARMRAGPQHSRFRGQRSREPREDHRAAGPDQARRVSRLGARHRAAHPDGRGPELPGAPGRRSAAGSPERLCRARQAHDGPAGAGVPDRPDPHQHVHAGAERSAAAPIPRSACRIRITRCRITRTSPPSSSGCTRSTSTTSSSLRIWSRSWPRRPKATARCSTHTLFLYGTGISDSNTHFHDDLPIALVGGKATGIKGGRYIRYPKGTPLTNLHVTILEKLGVPVEKLGDSTGKLEGLLDV